MGRRAGSITCRIDECSREADGSRGMCPLHYTRVLKGRMDDPDPFWTPYTCSACGAHIDKGYEMCEGCCDGVLGAKVATLARMTVGERHAYCVGLLARATLPTKALRDFVHGA